jgi:RNA polymerase sigma-70 factor (ECF subfamily)
MCLSSDVDDLVQECFIKVWKGLADFRGDASIKTWVTRIAINTAHDYFRRKGRDPQTEELDESIEAQSISATDDKDVVKKALECLSVPHREVLILNILEEHTIEEISELLGVPAGTIKSRLFHAREQMKQILEKNGVRYE